ncbi:Vacuolar protein sorting-associated protein 52 A [Babesia sp. Xinjiang]|uniref:Vacuolar protein sorting-associated protein 52 A n=1 Tax=Babesia sp. Xinjiang TaxID=462227 RepID=UPI000A22B4FE|nr:Vacuolar protein sorting-associated protein 52 A [Babesia sp. Xinjiang]ORM42197.1 Vacuolar protein sorting-associated protein 52 A [Babesia sp. Xinjiang]
MERDQNIAKLLAISPETLADDLIWYLEGFDAASSLTDIEPWRNKLVKQYFENPEEEQRQESVTDTAVDDGQKESDAEMDMGVILRLKEIVKRVEDAKQRWQDNMMETFMRHEQEICEFSTDMNYCDSTLKLIEEALMKHYKSLEAASTDIKNLHTESAELSACLDNRQTFVKALKSFLDDIAIPPPLIKAICNGPIGEGYVKSVEQFQQKVHKMKTQYDNAPYPALQPTKIQLKKLELVIVGRIYDYMRVEIAKLATPKANIQMIQNTHFMKLRPLIAFVKETNANYAAEIQNQYAKTLRKIYYHLFSSYYTALEQCCTKNRYKDIGVLTKRSGKTPGGYFLLDDRDRLVLTFRDDPMVPTGIQPDSLSVEVIFKSFLKLLVDTASSEYIFISQFFEQGPTAMFTHIFEDTIMFVRSRIEVLLKTSFDVVMLTTLTLLFAANRQVMLDRGITALDVALGRIQTDIYSRAMHHIQNMAKYVMSYTLQASSSTLESWLPGVHAINLSNLVHSILRLKATQESLGITPISFDPLDHLIQVALAALTLRGRELNNPIKMNVFVIANCSAFLKTLDQFSNSVADFEYTRDKHVKAYANAYVRIHFKGIIELANVITDEDTALTQLSGEGQEKASSSSQQSAEMHDGSLSRWRTAADEFVNSARDKFHAIQSKVQLHFVQDHAYQLVTDAVLQTIEYIYAAFHQNAERRAKHQRLEWFDKLPDRTKLRPWLLNSQT